MQIEPYYRMIDPAILQSFRDLKVQDKNQLSIMRVNRDIDWSSIKAVRHTEKHDLAMGTNILVARSKTSRVIYFEIAPMFGRLWHEKCFCTNYIITSMVDCPPIFYYNLKDDYTDVFLDNINNIENMNEAFDRISSIRERITDPRNIIFSINTAERISEITGLEIYNPIITEFMRVFPGFTENSRSGIENHVISGTLAERKMSINHMGRNPNSRSYTQYSFHGIGSGLINTEEIPRVMMPGIEVILSRILYPTTISNRKLNSMSLPFSFVDTSTMDWFHYGKEGYVDVIIPGSVPSRYHYPSIWHLLEGEKCRLPYAYDGGNHLEKFIFTHDGNMIPLDCFELA